MIIVISMKKLLILTLERELSLSCELALAEHYGLLHYTYTHLSKEKKKPYIWGPRPDIETFTHYSAPALDVQCNLPRGDQGAWRAQGQGNLRARVVDAGGQGAVDGAGGGCSSAPALDAPSYDPALEAHFYGPPLEAQSFDPAL